MELKQTLTELIKYKTVPEDKRENGRAITWIKNQLKGLPLNITIETSNGFKNLIVTTKKTKQPKLLLQAHNDVVHADAKLFKPKLIGGKLYGRGAYDMKFATACFIKLLKELGPDAKKYDLGMIITSDEEIGGYNGVSHLIEQGYGAELCIMPDGGEDWHIEDKAKGKFHLSVKVVGKSSHASRPWEGINAINNLIIVLNQLQACVDAFDRKDENFYSTMSVGKISGGSIVNQVAHSAEAEVDVRLADEGDDLKFMQAVETIVGQNNGTTIDFETKDGIYVLDTKNPYVRQFQDVVAAHKGFQPEFVGSHGSSDARHFSHINVPVILTRPTGGGAHSDEEWIDLKELEIFYQVIKEFALRVAK